jgi:hypothetical protein
MRSFRAIEYFQSVKRRFIARRLPRGAQLGEFA